MKKTDEQALVVENYLRQSYCELSREVGEYANIIGVFFHEIMVYVTNFILLDEENGRHQAKLLFPFLNSEYVANPFPIKFSQTESTETSYLEKGLSVLSEIRDLFVTKKIKVLCSRSRPRQLLKLLLSTLLISPGFVTQEKLYLPKQEFQFSQLKMVLVECFKRINRMVSDIVVTNFIEYARFLTGENEKLVVRQDEVLLCSTTTDIDYRIIASNILAGGGSVISVIHGLADIFRIDEPVMGYGDSSYCTHMILPGSNKITTGQYNKSLHCKSARIYGCGSKEIKKIHQQKKKIVFGRKAKGLYIANGMSAPDNKRYGPFRDIPQYEYEAWQKELMQNKSDLILKGLDCIDYSSITNAEKLAFGFLENNPKFFTDYDYYVVDYMSTGLELAAATDKPILYFNLGIRNIAPEAVELYKQRVFWVDVDLENDLKKQLDLVFHVFFESNKTWRNPVTETISLGNKTTKQAIRDALLDIMRISVEEK